MKAKITPVAAKPLSLVDRFRAVLMSRTATIADLERDANEAAQARDAALAKLAVMQGRRADMLLASAAERAAFKCSATIWMRGRDNLDEDF